MKSKLTNQGSVRFFISCALAIILVGCTTGTDRKAVHSNETGQASGEQVPENRELQGESNGRDYDPNDVLADIPNSTVDAENYDEFVRYVDLRYVNSPDPYMDTRGKLDLYVPKGDGPKPVLMFMHGGGLTGGSKDEYLFQVIAETFAARGIAVANVEYRLSPKVSFPAYIEDIASAFHWLKQRADQYGADPKNIFISGHSAGAYLSAMVGSDPQYLRAHGYTLDDIAGVIPISAQMYTHYTVKGEKGQTQNWIIDEGAPINFISAQLPPFLVLVGADETNLYIKGASDFTKAMYDARHPDIEMVRGPGREHMDVVQLLPEPNDLFTSLMVEFIFDRMEQ